MKLKIAASRIVLPTIGELLREQLLGRIHDPRLRALARLAQKHGLVMGKSNTFENDLMLLIFNNTNIADIGDATGLRGSTAAGSLWFSLHTADPGEAGTAVTSETAYTNYVRQTVNRASGAGGLTVTGNSVSPAGNVDFPACGATPGAAITHFGIVNTASGAGKLLYSGTVTPNITMAEGVIPRLTTASTITED